MSNEPRTPKEAVYDERISPLMAQIIALCKEHSINMAAQFSLGVDEANEQTLFCTTCLPVDESDEKGHERVMTLRRHMYPPRSDFFAFTIVKQ
jgi:hypothetical protein